MRSQIKSAGSRVVAMAQVQYDVSNVPSTSLKPPRSFPAPERHPGAPTAIETGELGLAGEVVRTLAPWTEADSSALLIDFLASFGSAVGPGPHMYAGDARHELKLFGVTVGPTSAGRKGTARSAVSRLFELAAPDWSRDNVQGGLSSGEGLIQAMADLPGSKNLLAVETEFSKVLVVGARNGNTVSEQLRQLWDTDRVRVLNKKPVRLDDAFLSLLGHITETELRAKASDVDLANGFGNRVLWVYSQRSKLIPDGTRVPEEVLIPLARRVSDAIARAQGIREMTRSKAARERWRRLYLRMAETRFPGLLGAVTDRREAQCVRLAIIFAALDGQKRIRPEHIDAAYRVWRYCEESAAFIFGQSSGDPRADKVVTALRQFGGKLTRSLIRKNVFSDNVSKDQLDAIRDRLKEEGLLKVKRQDTKGRWAEVWTLIG